MYGRGDSTPFCGESSQSLLDFLNCSLESHDTDVQELNLAAAEMLPFSSESFIPAIPSFGALEDDEYGTDDGGFLFQDPQVKPFFLPTFGLPDTPAAELSGENVLCPEPELAEMSPMSFQRPDRASGQSGEVFKFPSFVVDSNKSPPGPPFPASLSAPPTTTPTRPSLTLEDQLISLETPPATPKQDAGVDDGPSFQRRPTVPQRRRARLGGVSAVSSSGSDPELDEQDDLQQDDLDVVFPDVMETPDVVPDAPGTTSGLKTPGWEEQVLGRDGDDPLVDDVVFDEGDAPGPASESHASASAAADWSDRLKRAWQRSQGSQSLEPLLKEELRLKILTKRLESGQEEMDVEVTEPPRYEMTEEEHAKRDVRRAQNRGAARRFRQKKKQNETELKKKLEDSVAQHRQLTREVDALRREVARLKALMDQHHQCGDCRLQQAVCHVAPGDALHVPDVTALCRQIGPFEDIDARPR